MRKKTAVLMVTVAMLIAMLSACSNTKKVEEELRGQWSYLVDGLFGYTYKQVYDFRGDGTVRSTYNNQSSTCTYEIKSGKITLYREDGSVKTVLEYTYKNGTLRMFDVGSDGSMNYELKR
nr:hypothetical protein [Lachnospiraceae bacterium]